MKKFFLWQRWIIASKNKPGIGLLELVVALAIIACIALGAMSGHAVLTRVTARSELHSLRATCHYLQRCARVHSEPCSLHIDAATGKYTFLHREHALSKGCELGFLPGVKGPPSSPTAPITSAITYPSNTITFHPDGSMSAGTVYFVDRNKTMMFALTSPVAHVSYLRLYEYDGAWRRLS